MKFIEWFFRLFFKKKADIVKQDAIFERQASVVNYKKEQEKAKKHNKRYTTKGNLYKG